MSLLLAFLVLSLKMVRFSAFGSSLNKFKLLKPLRPIETGLFIVAFAKVPL